MKSIFQTASLLLIILPMLASASVIARHYAFANYECTGNWLECNPSNHNSCCRGILREDPLVFRAHGSSQFLRLPFDAAGGFCQNDSNRNEACADIRNATGGALGGRCLTIYRFGHFQQGTGSYWSLCETPGKLAKRGVCNFSRKRDLAQRAKPTSYQLPNTASIGGHLFHVYYQVPVNASIRLEDLVASGSSYAAVPADLKQWEYTPAEVTAYQSGQVSGGSNGGSSQGGSSDGGSSYGGSSSGGSTGGGSTGGGSTDGESTGGGSS